MTEVKSKKTYLTAQELGDRYSFMSYGSIRHLIQTDRDFKKKCVRRFGRRVLLCEEDVLEFIENNKG